jgi:hypothetical protein
MRMSFVLGKPIIKKRSGGKKKLPEMKDALEDEKEDLEQWEGGLDPIVGWEEWKSLAATFERALMWLPKVRYFVCLFDCSKLIFNVAATIMDYVPVAFLPSTMPGFPFTHACTPYF